MMFEVEHVKLDYIGLCMFTVLDTRVPLPSKESVAV